MPEMVALFDVGITFASEFWAVLCEMAPYLLFGFLMAGLLSVFISAAFVERHLGGRGIWPVVKASILGVPLPLCSCGVIPVAASLRRHKATRGATTAFLISTPQTGVDSIFVTFSLLGMVFAIFRPVAALVSGMIGGFAVDAAGGPEKGEAAPSQNGCHQECCSPNAQSNRWIRAFRYGFVTLARDIAWPLIVGLIIAGVISAIVPDDFFAAYLGAGLVPMLIMMAVGIPVYVCATASVPIAAALMMKGVSPGAALVFLMTGPATNAATVTTIWKILGARSTAIYLAAVAGTALASGMALDYIFAISNPPAAGHVHAMLPGYVKAGAAIVLLGVLVNALVGPFRRRKGTAERAEGAEKIALSIKGMTCSHCVESVSRALRECSGVRSVQVDLKPGRAVVAGDRLDDAALTAAVKSLGYEVTAVERR